MAGSSSKKGRFPVRRANKSAQLRQMLRDHDLATKELKMKTFVNSGTLSSSGTIQTISSQITQGDNVSGRTGYNTHVKVIKLWVQATMNTSATTDRIRYILFYDRLNVGTAPVIADVLDTAGVLSDYTYFAQSQNRFKILVDKTVPMSINANSRAINYQHEFKFPNPVVVSSLGTTNNEGKNSFYLLLMDDLGANNSTYAISITVRYFDD